ncbi:hypothetical protein G7059_01685 [Erysipelothrix sp. HDW6A]|uniref:hypothetical protein n=1 Tax=Erysipelothrix sp. HDW6A TaxID=2714928 RepID=UPI00140AF90E|nr:hypothetical protein [Erysipelothrix sp. HDW6A]QIK56645.1 hypothetical protein G7059_01685 [Erysipelothrix sp. HDW6A]
MAEKIGFIKLERKIIDWEWYTDINVKSLFIHMLLLANHSGKQWRGQEIERGSFVTSLGSLSVQTGLSLQSVRTSINKLKKTGEITIKSTNKNTLIIVTNYDIYQGYYDDTNKQDNNQSTNEQQSTNKQLTTTKNVKNYKNDNNVKNNTLVGIEMPLADGSIYSFDSDYILKAQDTFPNVNVEVELKKASLWLESNPSRRKKKSGMKRFMNAWLNRESDKVNSDVVNRSTKTHSKESIQPEYSSVEEVTDTEVTKPLNLEEWYENEKGQQ